jgi:hypothetical protein
MVVKCFQDLLAASGLGEQVTLKGSFCLGQCRDDDDGVTLRLEGEHFRTRYQDAEACFASTIKPRLEELLADA